MIEKYKPHPIAEIFPMIADAAFEKLKADIQQNGIKEPGLLFEGKVLDGRNRHKAACELGIEMNWQEVELGEPEDIEAFDPVSYVLSQNLHRRHLKDSQRAMIAAKMATLKHGQAGNGRKVDSQICESTREDAAAALSVKLRSLDAAKHVLGNGSKELIDAVANDHVSVSQAEKLCKACDDKREQTRLAKEGRKAISEYLNPTPHEGDPNVDDDTPEYEDCEIGDQYEYPIIKMFKHADYRMNTLKMLVNELSDSEKMLLKEWIASP